MKKGEKAFCLNPACPEHEPSLLPAPKEAKKGRSRGKGKPPLAPPKDWEELVPFLPGLSPEERRAVEALARGEALAEEEARLARRALFKLRMRKGKARKEPVRA